MAIIYRTGLDKKAPIHAWDNKVSPEYAYIGSRINQLRNEDLRSDVEAMFDDYCSKQAPPCGAQFQVLMNNFWDLCGRVDGPSEPKSLSMIFVYDSTLLRVRWGSDGNSRPPLGLFPFCDETFENIGRKFLGVTAHPGKCRNLVEAALIVDMFYMTNRANTAPPSLRTEVQEAVAKLDAVRVAGFWHIGRMGTMWQDIVKDQMKKIIDSGIDKRTQVIHAVMAGQGEELPVSHPKLNVSQGPGLESYEFPTLALLEEYCLENPNDLVWYVHSKGVSRSPADAKDRVVYMAW